MAILPELQVVQIGNGLAAAVCGRLLADVGADVTCIDPDAFDPARQLSQPRQDVPLRRLGCSARCARDRRSDRLRRPARTIFALGRSDAAALRRINAAAALVFISPFGQTGPQANDPATDLTLFFASGIARLLTGQVDDLAEPPIRPVGEQSAFIGGIAAACAGMHAALAAEPGAGDRRLDRGSAGDHGDDRAGECRARREKPVAQAAGATATGPPSAILPAARRLCGDLAARGSSMGRVARGDGLARLGKRSALCHQTRPRRQLGCAARADVGVEPASRQAMRSPIRPRPPMCRASRCASRPNSSTSPQLAHRNFWRPLDIGGRTIKAPGPPFGLQINPGERQAAGRAKRADAALRHSGPRFQLGHRRADGNALSRGDGRRGDQDRGARPRRSGPRLRIAHGARPGEARHRPRPQAAARRSPSRGRWPRNPTC